MIDYVHQMEWRMRTFRRFRPRLGAGALLAMVADTMLPEAYEVEKAFTGSLVAIGFATSLILSSL